MAALTFASVLALPQSNAPDGAMSARVKQTHLQNPSAQWKEGLSYHALLHGNSTDEYRSTIKHRYYEQAVANATVRKAKLDAQAKVAEAQREVEIKIQNAQKGMDAAIALDNKRLRNLINVAASLGVTLQQAIAFENCSSACDRKYWCGQAPCDARNVDETVMQAAFNNKDLWSSCFAGCNLGVRKMPLGNNVKMCKNACYGEAKVPWWCDQACDDYSAKAQAFAPTGAPKQAVFNDKLKLAQPEPVQFEDDSDPVAMKQRIVDLKDHVARLKAKLGSCESTLAMYE
jgi:hypothetical protein